MSLVEQNNGSEEPQRQDPQFQIHRGFQFPPVFKTENILSALTYEAKPGNIFIATYPRSGTTWMQNIMYLIVHAGEPVPPEESIDGTIPYLEKYGRDFVEKIPAPGVIKTHLRYDLVPKNPEAKYVYILRNPKDQVVSYYFHAVTQRTQGFYGDFNDYFECFIRGAVPYGDYFDHLDSWLPHVDDPNILMVTYEEMKEDLNAGLLKIGHFLGDQYAKIVDDDAIREKIVYYSDFKNMKKDASRWRSPEEAQKGKSFMRKGEVGDWKNYLSEDQSKRLDEKFLERTKGTIIEHIWDKYMS